MTPEQYFAQYVAAWELAAAEYGRIGCEGDYPTIGPGWDPYEVLARYVEAAAAEGAQWAIDQLATETPPGDAA